MTVEIYLNNIGEPCMCTGLLLSEEYTIPGRPVLVSVPSNQNQFTDVVNTAQCTLRVPNILDQELQICILRKNQDSTRLYKG